MTIYDETKLYDNVHIQKKTPNPQIYALFEMGLELEQYVVAGDVSIDTALSTTSANPVENRVITNALNEKADVTDLADVALSGSYDDLTGTPGIDSTIDSTSSNAVENSAIASALATKANSSDLATVATTGSYNDLTDTPTIDSAMSSSSKNAVENKVINAALEEKVDTDLGNVSLDTDDAGKYYRVANDGSLKLVKLTEEKFTFTLSDGSTVTRTILTKPEKYGYAIVQIDESILDNGPYDATTYPSSVTVNGNTYTNCITTGWTPFIMDTPGSWKNHPLITGIRPVYIEDGVITGYPSLTDMSSWDTSKDVFTQFPFNWLSITKSGDVITIIFSDDDTQPDSSFKDYAFLNNSGVRQDAFHIGCAEASLNGSVLASRPSTSPLVSTSITQFINYATANGSDYDIITYDQSTYLTALAILLFKTPDMQGSSDNTHGLGLGYTSGSAVQTNPIITYTNNYGMSGDTTSGTTPVSFFWITNLFGNINQWVGGAYVDSSYKLCINRGERSSISAWNTTIETGLSANVSGACVKSVIGTSDGGFFPLSTSGSDYTKGFTDDGVVTASRFPYWGGTYGYGANSGVFRWNFNLSAANTNGVVGSRLSCKIGSA